MSQDNDSQYILIRYKNCASKITWNAMRLCDNCENIKQLNEKETIEEKNLSTTN